MTRTSRLLLRDFLPFVFFVSVFAGCLFLGPQLFNSDGDLGRHLTIGKYILEGNPIPTTDHFSNTLPGVALVPHEWLAEVILTWGYNLLGLSGDVVLTGLILAIVFAILSRWVYERSHSTLITILLVTIGLAASRIHWLVRPHIFTYFLMIAWIMLFSSDLPKWRKTLLAVTLMVIWVNTHGAFVYGFAFLGVIIISKLINWFFQKEKQEISFDFVYWLVTIGLLLAATLCNPSSWQIWTVVFRFLTSGYLVEHTAEYHPPVLNQAQFIPFDILLILSLVICIFRFRKLSAEQLLLLVCFSVLALTSMRNIPIFVMIALPILASELGSLLPRLKFKLDQLELEQDALQAGFFSKGLLAAEIFIVIFSGILFKAVPELSARNTFFPDKFPVAAVDWMAVHPKEGNLFNQFEWGGYLLYRLWPAERVFIDGQTDFYGEALTRDYETLIRANDGWEKLAEEYQLRRILVPPNSALAQALMAKPGKWHILYKDETALYWGR